MGSFKAFVISSLLFVSVSSAAIDCSIATTDIDVAICSNAEIFEYDEALNQLYFFIRRGLDDEQRQTLLTEQQAWVITPNNQCPQIHKDCLINQYQQRTSQLREHYLLWLPMNDDELIQVTNYMASQLPLAFFAADDVHKIADNRYLIASNASSSLSQYLYLVDTTQQTVEPLAFGFVQYIGFYQIGRKQVFIVLNTQQEEGQGNRRYSILSVEQGNVEVVHQYDVPFSLMATIDDECFYVDKPMNIVGDLDWQQINRRKNSQQTTLQLEFSFRHCQTRELEIKVEKLAFASH